MKRSLCFVFLFILFCTFSQAKAEPLQTVTATVTVTQCDSLPPVDIRVTFTGKESPWYNYVKTTDSSGIVFFDSIETGIYDLELFKIGYQTIFYHDITINENYSLTDILRKKIFPVRNLVVDSITSVATWDKPLITALPLETFEDTVFPPPGWQISYDQCTPWYRAGPDEPFGDWVVPEWEGHYALYNDELQGGCPAAHYNYLITPEIDLRDDENYKLTFDLFFEGWYGEKLTIRYSVDSGQTWVPLTETYGYNKWRKEVVDLSAISGADGLPAVMLAFVYFDGGGWAAGVAVDNVQITGDPAAIKNYYVSLDGNTVAVIPPEKTAYTFNDLVFGQFYTASVQAAYICTISEPVTYSWQSGYLYQPINLETEYTYNTDEVLLTWNPPVQNGQIPQGLLSFNIYRNDSIVVNVPYQGQQPDDELLYIDNNVFPDDYVYKVTALYDLTQFGYAGETGESGPSNKDTVAIRWGMELPFTETWAVPNFEFNQWNIDTICWKINADIGNEAPSAQFSADSILTNYQISLSSVPFRGDYFEVGDIWLDFNLKLDDNTASGTEHLLAEVYNGETWQTVFDTTNNGSFSFDDCFKHINISDIAIDDIFRVRYRATGDSSANISSWFVDNINIYRTCSSPVNLEGETIYFPDLEADGILLKWRAPQAPVALTGWKYWDSGENFSGCYLSDFYKWSLAVCWKPEELAGFHRPVITKVRFYLLSDAFNYIYVNIWDGDNGDNLVYSQRVNDTLMVNSWNEVVLDTPVPVDKDKDLYVGCSLYGTAPDAEIIGIDEGPEKRGRGDFISFQNDYWELLWFFGYDNNWNFQVYFDESSSYISNTALGTTFNSNYSAEKNTNEQNKETTSTNRLNFLAFEIYRSETGQEASYVPYATVPYIVDTTDYQFIDNPENLTNGQSYWYKVSALWAGDSDSCESPFARSKYMPDEDYVTVLVTGINDKDKKDVVTIYPIPAHERVTVNASEIIEKIVIINFSGKAIFSKEVNRTKFILNTEHFNAGVYIAKIFVNGKVTIKRFVVVK